MTTHQVKVELAERSYSVLVGHGTIDQLEAMLPKSAKRAVLVTQSQIGLQPKLKIESTTVFIGEVKCTRIFKQSRCSHKSLPSLA